MFKTFALVFAAVLAVTFAEPKPGYLATSYSSPIVAASPYAYSAGYAAAPLAYSAGYAAPLAYSAGYAAPLAHSAYSAYAAPIAHTYY